MWKAARGRATATVMITVSGGGIERRLDGLLDARPSCPGGQRRRVGDYVAMIMVCVTRASMVALPATTFAGDLKRPSGTLSASAGTNAGSTHRGRRRASLPPQQA